MDNKKEQKRTTDKKVMMIKALGTTLGNVQKAIDDLKKTHDYTVSRTAHYKWLKEDEEYAQAVEDASDKTLDLVEEALINQVKNGSVQATMFYLKTKGRNRGYNEKLDVDITSGEEPIQIIFNKKS
jgi:hypothetical protein